MATNQYRWNIFVLRATPATPIGSVEAPDAASAIKKAIEVFEITDPQKQKRLIAQRA
jgi:1,2-phenylacetyl-CoA epoxidase PaaB subunit